MKLKEPVVRGEGVVSGLTGDENRRKAGRTRSRGRS